MDPERVQALTFDVFGTVVDWRSGIMREAAALGRAAGVEADWGAFADQWRALYQPAMERVRSGAMDFVKLDVLHRTNLDLVLDRFGLGALSEAQRERLNRAWHRLDPWPDAVDGLTRLRRRYVLATLSNGNLALLVNMARRAGLPWDAVLGAEVAGHYKPQAQAYRRTADLLGLAPELCMMVAAHAGDLEAARACGFRTAFVHRPLEHGPDGSRESPAGRDFDLVADDFLHLAHQLGC